MDRKLSNFYNKSDNSIHVNTYLDDKYSRIILK